ncbi:hypothetical protein AN958_04236 [Leucoagaricus sp. SymC.cos]|nr:hypothetical protein AN958_04236 [Leucoagaricus sp. SymC.cos]
MDQTEHGLPRILLLSIWRLSQKEKEIIVAKEAESLQVIIANINRYCSKEALLDNGSQIISMSREVAILAHISWDSDAAILMQSVSGHTEKTCSLAKDVPFYLGGIVVYLQVHILPNSPYWVLLGQPFDALM